MKSSLYEPNSMNEITKISDLIQMLNEIIIDYGDIECGNIVEYAEDDPAVEIYTPFFEVIRHPFQQGYFLNISE